ncbi:hypothetical protein GGI07_003941 [Coemansia sp. Benny D115]|nr:hypothetical protein GGI07_003941 [Coemansia sp. Benny D115]
MLVSNATFLCGCIALFSLAVVQWRRYTRCGNPHEYLGLYGPAILAFAVGCLVASSIEFYYLFLVPARWSTPVFGEGAPESAVEVVAQMFISSAVILLLLVVRRLPSSAGTASAPDTLEDIDTRLRTPAPSVDQSQAHQQQHHDLKREQSPELGSSILSNALFNWMQPFIELNQRRQPRIGDLYMPSEKYTMSNSWARFVACRRQGSSLFWNLMRTFKAEVGLQIFFNPVLVALEYTHPFLMQRLLHYIDGYAENKSGLRYGFFLATAMFISNLVAAQVEQQQAWHMRSLVMRVRNVLVTLLTQKTLRRASKSAGGSDWGAGRAREDKSDGRAYNILTADVARMSKVIPMVELLTVVPLQQALGAWYMYKLLGVSGVVGTLLLLQAVYMMRQLVVRANRMEVELGKLNDRRLAGISEMIQGITSIKLFGWGSQFIEIIGERRAQQLKMLWSRAKVWCWLNLWTMGSLPIINFTAFALYSMRHDLDAATIFTAIAVFMIIQRSVSAIPAKIANTIGMLVSFRRICEYLAQDEVQPLEQRIGSTTAPGDSAVGFENATLVWGAASDSRAFALKALSVRFPAGKLTLIGGPTGSGKSSMLSALIGDMTLVSGQVLVPTTAAAAADGCGAADLGAVGGLDLSDVTYVAQEPWLRNATIQDNILFGEPYNQQRYERVLQVCALLPDLLALSAGDMTEVGERGITLSGGQKQRVALARAMYSSNSTLLIDDCLSAVDAHTGRHILHQCLLSSNELVDGRTRVLVTHHMAMCLPHCDYVVMLSNGGIEFQGTPQEWHAHAGSTFEDAEAQSGRALASSESRLSLSASSSSPSDISLLQDAAHAGTSADEEASSVVEPLVSTPMSTPTPTDRSAGKLVKDEERVQGSVKAATWKIYFDPCGGWPFVLGCIGGVLAGQLLSIYKDYYLATQVGRAQGSAGYMLGVYLLFGFLAAVCSSLTLLWMYLRSLRASISLHDMLLHAMVYATPRFLDTTPIGRIMSRFSKDIQIIDEDVMELLEYFLKSFVSVLLTLVVISSSVPQFIVVGVGIMVVYTRVSWNFMQCQRETKRLEGAGFAPMISLYSEIIPGSGTIRGFGMQQAYMVEMERRFTEFLSTDLFLRVMRRWLAIRMSLASSLVSFFTAVFILLGIDRFSSGLAGFTLIYAVRFWSESTSVVRKYSSLELSVNCIERAHQYMVVEQEAEPRTVPQKRYLLQEGEWPRSGTLVVRDLVAGYTPDRPVLHGVSFTARDGEKIGIVGRTGAGKSTLSLALLRFVEAQSGSIELDGVDISQLGLEDLRQSVTIIPQDPALFNGTVRFNLDPFGHHTDDELLDALERTLLLRPGATAAFDSLEDEITSHGQSLSLGQRQLVSLARAMVRRSRLIIMDEATASVDFQTDSRIQAAIRGPEFTGCTLLCIAHRLRTVVDYDRVLVLDNGRVAEFDTPEKLLQKEAGMFRAMCEDSGEMAFLQSMVGARHGIDRDHT